MRATTESLFWQHVDRTDGCWIWTGQRHGPDKWKYGLFHVRRRRVQAHRYSWQLANGPIPDGLFVLHTCDNPPCVRPDHLWIGTTTDNMRDMVAKGRDKSSRKTACCHGHPFTPENTYMQAGRRQCRRCIREAQSRYRTRRKGEA